MTRPTLYILGALLLLTPAASASSLTIGTATSADADVFGQPREATLGGYVVVADDGSVAVYHESNGCDGLQTAPTERCEDADRQRYPVEDAPTLPEPPAQPPQGA